MSAKMILIVGLAVIVLNLPVCQARVVVDPGLLEWILDQQSVGGYSVREWREHYAQWDQEAWARYYSTWTIRGQLWEAEQWMEFWSSPENHDQHALEEILVELGETVLLHFLRGAYRLFRRAAERGGRRFSPY